MDDYTLFLIKNNSTKYNVTKLISNLTWSDNIDTLGTQLTFDFVRNLDDVNIKNFDILEVGDKVILSNNSEEIFRGIIADSKWSRYGKGVTVFDYGFYLNKSKTIKQFKDISATKAITELCRTFGITIGEITNISTSISKIYKDKTIAEIIKDILNQAENELGTKYRLEMRKNKLYINEYIDLTITATFQPTSNSSDFNVLNAIGDIQKSESIDSMRNSIMVTSQDEGSDRVIELVEDSDSIEKYGLLQEVLQVDDKNESQTNTIAQNKLAELNKVQSDITLNLLGNDILRAGRILNIENDVFALSGSFLIKSSSHTFNNSIHKTSITVKEV